MSRLEASTPQRSHARSNRQRILAVAQQELIRNPDASMDDIARAAGVVRRTVYGHFPSREALLRGLADVAAQDVMEAVDQSRFATDRPERVRSLTLINSVGGAPGQRAGLVDASWLRWMLGTVGELSPRDIARSTPGMLRDFLPNVLRKPLSCALSARLALTVDLADEAAALVASGVPVLFFWGDNDKLVLPGSLGQVTGHLPNEVVAGRHGWLLSRPEEFASLLRNALDLAPRRSRAAARKGVSA